MVLLNSSLIYSIITTSFFACLAIRLLILTPVGYKSTDFEVHRNWLAVTGSQNLSQWYIESTSPWTLDYPPFFAWFEWILAKIAKHIDSNIIDINNLNYDPIHVVFFQRLTVIAMDCMILIPGVFAFVWEVANHREKINHDIDVTNTSVIEKYNNKFIWAICLTCLNAGLLLVDHIHFQYNGFLIGILFFALASAVKNYSLLSACLFSILLHFKHIFAYMGPPLAIYLVYDYCIVEVVQKKKDLSSLNKALNFLWLSPPLTTSLEKNDNIAFVKLNKNLKKEKENVCCFSMYRFCILALAFISISGISLLPFVYTHQLSAIISRLFPFGRGLTHTYWAPNIWAVYLTLDRFLIRLFNAKTFSSNIASPTMGTGGMTQTGVLPNIAPLTSLICVTCFGFIPLLLYLIHRWKKISSWQRCLEVPVFISIGNYIGFFFGWHVHEKAILYSTLPLGCIIYILNDTCFTASRAFTLLNLWSNFSILPLLHIPSDTLLKLSIWIGMAMLERRVLFNGENKHNTGNYLINIVLGNASFYIQLIAMIFLVFYENFRSTLHQYLFGNCMALQFLPLLLTSFTSSVFIAIYMLITTTCYFKELSTLFKGN